MMKTARQRIIDFLEKKVIASPGEISIVLHMPTVNVRHYLRNLVEEGIIIHAGQRNSKTPGRPESLYRLQRPAVAHNLNQLASALIQSISAGFDPGSKEAFFRNLAQFMVTTSPVSSEKHLATRLQVVIKKLNEMNYQARWEARSLNPRIILEHCPYYAIIDQHPELCMMDEALISGFSGADSKLVEKLRNVRPGLRHCIFQVKSQ